MSGIIFQNLSLGGIFLNAISIKKTEEKLEKKKAKLQKLLTTKNQIEYKIKLLRADIEDLQTRQFEQFKKAAKKENIEIRADDIPKILQLIKSLQQSSKTSSENTNDETVTNLDQNSKTDSLFEEDYKSVQHSGLRTLDSLQSIESFYKS